MWIYGVAAFLDCCNVPHQCLDELETSIRSFLSSDFFVENRQRFSTMPTLGTEEFS